MAVRSTIRWDRFGNPFDTYANLDNMAATADVNIARAKKEQQDEETKRLRDLELGAIKAKNIQSLMISSNTEFQPLDAYAQDMTREMVDKYSSLVSELEKGKIDTNFFFFLSAKIQGQVPQVKDLIKGIETTAGKYAAGLAQGTLSMANSPEQEQFYKAIINNRGKFGMDENNILTYYGQTDGDPPEDFSIPANRMDRMPQPMEKVVSFVELTNPIISDLQTPVDQIVDGRAVKRSVPLGGKLYQQKIDAGFDAFIREKGNDGLRSLAADHAGYTREEIEKDLNSGFYEAPDGIEYTSKLEYDMDQLYQQTAEDNYVSQEVQNFQQKSYDLQLSNANKRNALQAEQLARGTTLKQQSEYRTSKTLQTFEAPDLNNPESLRKWGRNAQQGKSIVKTKDGKFALVVTNSSGKRNASELIPEEIINNPTELAKYLSQNVHGLPIYQLPKFNYKRTTPINRLAKFFTGKK